MIDFHLIDIVDIVVVAMLIYYIYRLIRDSSSLNVFLGIIIFLVVWLFVSRILEMRLLGAIMDKFISVGMLALIVIFQQEIRDFLFNLGTNKHLGVFNNLFSKEKLPEKVMENDVIAPIVEACKMMSEEKVGALIVIQREDNLETVLQEKGGTGEYIDARIDSQLIRNIFFKNSPLHDGAMLIIDGRIKFAQAQLPQSRRDNIPKRLGMRHRAAIGMSEVSDAVTVVVSEETGNITATLHGDFINYRMDEKILIDELKRILIGIDIKGKENEDGEQAELEPEPESKNIVTKAVRKVFGKKRKLKK